MISDLMEDIVATIDQLAEVDPPAELNLQVVADVRASAKGFRDVVIPRVEAGVSAVAQAADAMAKAVEALLAAEREGPAADALRQTLKREAEAIGAQEALFDRMESEAQSHRDFFASSAGELAKIDRDVAAQLSAAKAASDAARAEADRLRRQIDRQNRNAVFNPVGRLVFEIRSLVERRKTSEQAARDAERRARDAASKGEGLRAPLAAIATLQGLFGQLVAAMQDISNAIAMITSMVDVQQDFAARIEAEPELFLNALEASLEVLRAAAPFPEESFARAS